MLYWSVALYDLGLTPDEFYECTPRQIDALIRRHERKIQGVEFLSAQTNTCIVNFSMARPKEPVEPRDFMPSEWAKKAPAKYKRRKREVIAMELRANMEAFMRTNRG